jgi:DNA-binding transcriptional regulator LsrR (DeoR family)
LYRIAQAYYVEGLTQQEISQRFSLSRPKISRLLQQAREAKVVNIVLVPPSGGTADLEVALERRYGLEEVIVVSVSDARHPVSVARELGPAAAECLLRSLPDQGIVGLTWGSTILALVDALSARPWASGTIVQMNGGLGPVESLEHSTDLARRVAQKLNARLALLPAPGIVSSPEAARALRADKQIAETLALAARADVAIVGLGVPSPDAVLLRDGNILNADDLAALHAAGAVGDVALRYLDGDGHPLDLALNERIIGLTLEQLVHIPRVIGVAGGEPKYAIIRAALRGRLLDVLVTDHVTAQRLLAENA